MPDGYISKLERFSTSDGPGIRTAVYAIGCPMKCLWCTNPELIGDAAKFLYHPRRCVGCGDCLTKSGLEDSSVVCYYDAYKRDGGIISAKELVTGLICDRSYYDKSGGGVTFSGGDPALQSEFFYEVASSLKDLEIHVALDTAGYFAWEKLAPLISVTDLVLYDIKTLSRTLHKRYTGVDNQLILENAIRIADMGKDMVVRLILVPGVNDSDDEIIGRLKFVKNLGRTVKVDLIKYHKQSAGKYASLNMVEMMQGTEECSDDIAEYAANIARNMGIAVRINL